MQETALLIGNSDGIGLQATRLLLAAGYKVVGLSRTALAIDHPLYSHTEQDVTADGYKTVLEEIVRHEKPDLCIYFAGIGKALDLEKLESETKTFEVNLMGAILTTEIVLRHMLQRGTGHFIGLSSLMDRMVSPDAPAYAASKAGVSRYWEGLGLALKSSKVNVSNIRFGFVDTKMAQATHRPFMITAQQAAEFIFDVVKKPRIRASKPHVMDCIIWLCCWPARLKLLFK